MTYLKERLKTLCKSLLGDIKNHFQTEVVILRLAIILHDFACEESLIEVVLIVD